MTSRSLMDFYNLKHGNNYAIYIFNIRQHTIYEIIHYYNIDNSV